MVAIANVSRICCAKGCNRVAVIAERVSDFWVSRCRKHINQQITLDPDKTFIGVRIRTAKK